MNPRKPNVGELPIQIPANEMTVRASFPPKPRARANRPGHSCVCGRTLVARAGATGLSGEQSDAIIRNDSNLQRSARLMLCPDKQSSHADNSPSYLMQLIVAPSPRRRRHRRDTGRNCVACMRRGPSGERIAPSFAGIHELLTSHARSRYRWRTTCDSAISVHERAMLDLLSACQHGDAYRAGLLLRFLVRRDARTRLAEQATMLAEALRAGSRMLPHRPNSRTPCCLTNPSSHPSAGPNLDSSVVSSSAMQMRIACIHNP